MLVGFDHQCFRYICIINPSEIGVRFTNLANELGHRLVIWSYLLAMFLGIYLCFTMVKHVRLQPDCTSKCAH